MTIMVRKLKMFEYFREKISNKGVIFLQKIHYSEDTFDKRQDDFK